MVTASARSLPVRTGSIDADMGSNIISACPPIIASQRRTAAGIVYRHDVDPGHHLEQLAGQIPKRLCQ